MSIYAISDLHLPLGVEKPMDVFGIRWNNYVERIKENWIKTVKDEDYVIISGDISWATYLSEAIKDLAFINSLPGTKILSRGNHDYWWTTLKKMNELKKNEGFDKINFLQNDAYMIGKTAVAGCRGWITPLEKKFGRDDEKIYRRELLRMEMSINDAIKKGAEKIILSVHYPPLADFYEIIRKYNVDIALYGHLHHETMGSYVEISERTKLVSCDYLSFFPEKIIL